MNNYKYYIERLVVSNYGNDIITCPHIELMHMSNFVTVNDKLVKNRRETRKEALSEIKKFDGVILSRNYAR